MHKISISDKRSLFGPLAERGWSLYSCEGADAAATLRELHKLGDILGTRVAGRSGSLEEIIEPQSAEDAHPRSLSARYGFESMPFHAELSHRVQPCRYLLFGCIDPGSPAAATVVLNWRTLEFSLDELDLLESAPVLVRCGRRSFYSTILAPGGAYLRYDPCCLEPVSQRSHLALALMRDRIASASTEAHYWRRGDILIIDNWRVLHGRTQSDRGSGRRLARILIDA